MFRMGILALLLPVAFAFGSAAQAQNAVVPAALQNVHRVVCTGDSITAGGEEPGGYVWLLRHYLAAAYPQQPIEVMNTGISGEKSSGMLARFQRDVIDRKPDLVTISIGVNDVWHAFRDFAHNRNYPDGSLPNGVSLGDYRKNFERMIAMAEQAKIRVVLLSPTVIYEDLFGPENARLASYCNALREIARRRHCLYVDYQKPFRELISLYRRETGITDNLLTVDGVHMNPAGNRLMARALLTTLGVPAQALDADRERVEDEAHKKVRP